MLHSIADVLQTVISYSVIEILFYKFQTLVGHNNMSRRRGRRDEPELHALSFLRNVGRGYNSINTSLILPSRYEVQRQHIPTFSTSVVFPFSKPPPVPIKPSMVKASDFVNSQFVRPPQIQLRDAHVRRIPLSHPQLYSN